MSESVSECRLNTSRRKRISPPRAAVDIHHHIRGPFRFSLLGLERRDPVKGRPDQGLVGRGEREVDVESLEAVGGGEVGDVEGGEARGCEGRGGRFEALPFGLRRRGHGGWGEREQSGGGWDRG